MNIDFDGVYINFSCASEIYGAVLNALHTIADTVLW